MPYCINDPKKKYKGDEPSPKGLGYCAHTEELGTIKTGLDGNKWIISSTTKGIKRWIKSKKLNNPNKKENIPNNIPNKLIKIYSPSESLKEKWWDDSDKCDCSKFVSYKRNKGRKFGINHKDIHGLEFEKGKLYKFISFNNFAKKAINIDQEAWIKYKLDEYIIKRDFCGTKKKLTKDNPIYKKINHIGYKKYFTNNYQSENYLVYVKKEKDPVYVYRLPFNEYMSEIYFPENEYGVNKEWAYIQLLVKVIPEKIFIGTCPKNLKNWNCNGQDGSTILLKINKLNYIYIGPDVFTFTAKSEIIDFISLVPNKSAHPSPYAVDVDNNFYLMEYGFYSNKNTKVFNDIYDPYRYYDENEDDFKKIDNLKTVSYYD